MSDIITKRSEEFKELTDWMVQTTREIETLGGKILYPESGIFEVLKKNYRDFRPWNK